MRIPAADRTLAFLGYLPFLFWVPIKLKRDSMFAQFHGRQSGVLFGLWFTLCFLVLLVLFFLPANLQSDLSGFFFGTVYVLTGVYLLMAFFGIVKVLLGERYRMPVVAGLALRLRL